MFFEVPHLGVDATVGQDLPLGRCRVAEEFDEVGLHGEDKL